MLSGELDRLVELLDQHPGSSSIELRDALRRDGLSSITTADVERTLRSAGRRFASVDQRVRTAPMLPELYAWQHAALAAWRASAYRGVIEAVTGAGKTVVGLAAAAEELVRRGQVAVIVPTRELLGQWAALLEPILPPGVSMGLLGDGSRHGLADRDLVVAVVNSARDADLYPRRPGGLLIADECHRYGSERNRLVLQDRFPRRLGLSATFARPDDAHETLLRPYLGSVCYRLGYSAARAEGVIAPFDVTLVSVEFTDDERVLYDDLTHQMSKAQAELMARGLIPEDSNGALLAVISTLARGDDAAAVVARLYLRAMQERRRLMDDASAKRDAMSEIALAVRSATRTIVFTQSIEAAEGAASLLQRHGLRAAALHSGLARPMRLATMQSFRVGELEVITAPQVLDEGVDVPEADLAVVLGASRSRRQMVQRMGRVLRLKPDSRRARFVIVSVRDTIEDPLRSAHAAFLDEVIPVARSLRSVSLGETPLAPLLAP